MASAPQREHLADGRDLLLFFDGTARGQALASAPRRPDPRTLPARPAPGEVRYDALRGEWVAYAAGRQGRTHLPSANQCPLCPSTEHNQTEIPAADYNVVVFENRFPSFGPEQGDATLVADAGVHGRASGRCEVVAFDPVHNASLSQLPLSRMRTVVGALASRTAELSLLPGIAQVFVFENRGAQIGVTLHHPHGQIYAYPMVTPTMQLHLDQAAEHRRVHGGNLYQSILERERADGTRMLIDGEHWSAYVPRAARMPIEVHLMPHRHVGRLDELTTTERDELAEVYLRLLHAVDALYPDPTPYISGWFQAPNDAEGAGDIRLHLQLTSPRRAENKLKYLAGSEAVMGAFIGDVLPEDQADQLRAALADGAPQ